MLRHRSDILLRRSSLLPPPSSLRLDSCGFTLIEVVLGAMVIAIAIAAILGAYVGQVTLNEHARNLSLAIQDANRVIEQIRQRNSGCSTPAPDITPQGAASWDVWMNAGGPGQPKSMQPDTIERILVTCQDQAGAVYCPDDQMGAEWHAVGPATTRDPLLVTVAVCWRHRGRVIGECSWNGAALLDADGTAPYTGANNITGVIQSPAMLTTLVTCR